MPKLVRLYITQVIVGFGLSAVFVGLLLYANVGNLGHLVKNSSGGGLALVMLWALNGIVFAGAQFGITIMRMKDDGGTGGGGKRDDLPVMRAEPVPVKVAARRG
ncbi:hypothetical protein [Thiosulfatihalobacter marinus]|jgi:hypothetical protein|uniref:hypothetical protein n=1 Tax=Thiosulfatihalobacter marinus TaxID=2792481 RepID=UPI0018D970A4|nr:hypothetical protein [Thiosulfatihalobacter marinus]